MEHVKGQIDIAHQIDPNAWKLLLACSLFDQDAGVSREALGYVVDLSLAERDEGLAVLQRLTLLIRDDDDRFWVLPIVQGYAEAELSTKDFTGEFTKRWLDWLVEFTQKFGIDLDFHVERSKIVGTEYLNLLSAIRWCNEHEQWTKLIQLVEGTEFYPYLIGLYIELQEMLEMAMNAAKLVQDEQSEGRLLRKLGRLLWVQGQYERALAECIERAEKIALLFENDTELGRVSDVRSEILYNQGYVLEAEEVATTVFNIGERLDNLELKIFAAYRLSEFESRKRHFEKALEWLDRREQWCKELGWSRALAWTTYRQGVTLLEQGNSSIAETFLLKSLGMATPWSDRHLMARSKHRLAQAYADTGRLHLAFQEAEEAHDLFERLGMVMHMKEVEELLRNLPGNSS